MGGFIEPLKDKVILVVWLGALLLVAIKYCYESRRDDEEPLGMVRSEQQQIADKEAQKELCDKLHDSMIVSHATH